MTWQCSNLCGYAIFKRVTVVPPTWSPSLTRSILEHSKQNRIRTNTRPISYIILTYNFSILFIYGCSRSLFSSSLCRQNVCACHPIFLDSPRFRLFTPLILFYDWCSFGCMATFPFRRNRIFFAGNLWSSHAVVVKLCIWGTARPSRSTIFTFGVNWPIESVCIRDKQWCVYLHGAYYRPIENTLHAWDTKMEHRQDNPCHNVYVSEPVQISSLTSVPTQRYENDGKTIPFQSGNDFVRSPPCSAIGIKGLGADNFIFTHTQIHCLIFHISFIIRTEEFQLNCPHELMSFIFFNTYGIWKKNQVDVPFFIMLTLWTLAATFTLRCSPCVPHIVCYYCYYCCTYHFYCYVYTCEV